MRYGAIRFDLTPPARDTSNIVFEHKRVSIAAPNVPDSADQADVRALLATAQINIPRHGFFGPTTGEAFVQKRENAGTMFDAFMVFTRWSIPLALVSAAVLLWLLRPGARLYLRPRLVGPW